MSTPPSFDRLDERTMAHAADIHQIKDDIREIKETLAEAKGGWRMLMLVAGVAGTLGALLTKASSWLPAMWR